MLLQGREAKPYLKRDFVFVDSGNSGLIALKNPTPAITPGMQRVFRQCLKSVKREYVHQIIFLSYQLFAIILTLTASLLDTRQL